MTVEELSGIYYINKEIEILEAELYNLRNNQNFYSKNIISDMPRGGQAKDMFVEFTEKLRAVEQMLQYSLKRLQLERLKVEEFLNTVADPELRLIMRLRAVNNMKWEDIGFEIGLERTTVSKKFFKYFKNK